MNKDQQYAEAKAAWLRSNPNATPQEIESACRAIAERLGL